MSTDLSRYVGQECRYYVNGLMITVKILAAKRSYGRTRYLITPLAGSKSMWVQDGLQFNQEGA